jgi:hypothetical protein
MRTTSLRALAGVVAVLAVTGVAIVATRSATAAGPCDASVVPPSGTSGDLLLAVTGAPGRSVAVGIHFDGGTGRPLVLHAVDGQWQRVMIPIRNGAGTIQLQDAVTDGERTWAVGVLRNQVPMAGWLHGDRWRWSTPVDPGGMEDELMGVAIADDGTVWAVGKHQRGHDYQPLVERFDGHSWTIVPNPVVPGSAVLRDIARAHDGTMWAVGWSVRDGGDTSPLIERWDGSAWAVVKDSGPGLLSGIAVDTDGTATAVGWQTTPVAVVPVAWSWNGSIWGPMSPPAPSGRLTSVIDDGDSVVAVGSSNDASGIPVPLLVRRTGSTWTSIAPNAHPALPPPDPGGDVLAGVTGSTNAFLAVGTRDTPDAFGSLVVSGGC